MKLKYFGIFAFVLLIDLGRSSLINGGSHQSIIAEIKNSGQYGVKSFVKVPYVPFDSIKKVLGEVSDSEDFSTVIASSEPSTSKKKF